MKNQTVGWLCSTLKEADSIETRKILSEELLKRNADNRLIDKEAYQIALEYSSLTELVNLAYYNNNPCLIALIYKELENRVNRNNDKKMFHQTIRKIKIRKRKRKFI